jgi:phosphocarrier protein HPr
MACVIDGESLCGTGNNMIGKSFIIKNEIGLHARPVAVLVQTANKFESTIVVEKDGRRASAKNALDLLSLMAEKGAVVTVEIDGRDEREAMRTVDELVNNKFGERE